MPPLGRGVCYVAGGITIGYSFPFLDGQVFPGLAASIYNDGSIA